MSLYHEEILQNQTRLITIYPTIDPEIVIIPIVSSILLFPIFAFLIICCLKQRAARARKKARLAKRDLPYGEQSCASLARLSPPISGTNSGGRRFTNIDVELTTTVEIVTPDS